MKKIISISIFFAIMITSVIFFIHVEDKNGLFFYRLFFTILFEVLFIVFFGIASAFKGMDLKVKLLYFLNINIGPLLQFYFLYFAPIHFKSLQPGSKVLTTVLLIICGVEIALCFTLFAAGNVFSKD